MASIACMKKNVGKLCFEIRIYVLHQLARKVGTACMCCIIGVQLLLRSSNVSF